MVVVPDPKWKRSVRYYLTRLGSTTRIDSTYSGRQARYQFDVESDQVVVEYLSLDKKTWSTATNPRRFPDAWDIDQRKCSSAYRCALRARGASDFIARTIGQKLSERLGKPVLIENRPGGGTVVATVALAKAPPDGYTLLLVPGSTLTSNATVYKSLPYDPRKDFVPIALPSQVAFTLVVNPSLPVHSIAGADQIRQGKAR